MIPPAFAQTSKAIAEANFSYAREGEDIKVEARFYQSNLVSKAIFYYRTFNSSEFKAVEMAIFGISAYAKIPKNDAIPPNIEYYFTAHLKDGSHETFPLDYNISQAPLRLSINPISEKDKEVIVLSPEPGETVKEEDFFISISLLNASDKVDKSAVKLFVDNIDVTSMALFAGDLILFNPANFNMRLKSGAGALKIELYDIEGSLYHTYSVSYEVIRENYARIEKTDLKYNARMRAETRDESVKNYSTWYNNFSLDAYSEYKSWSLNGAVYITNEEKPRLQPNNRYSIKLEGDWLELAYGDVFPSFPSLILSGKRVRGFYGNLELGAINIKAAFGEINRAAEGSILYEFPRTDTVAADIIFLNDSTQARVTYGTFKRSLIAVRPSFGAGENFQWGFTYLHSKDEVGSVRFGSRPKENLVLGSDMLIGFDNHRFLFTAQGAFSLQNNDITTGTMSDDLIDSVFSQGSMLGVDSKTIKDIKKLLGSLITVNQYITPLNPHKLPTAALEVGVGLNYFDNYLKGSYVYRGVDYQSFGQSTIRTDVAGFNFIDRYRFLNRQAMLSIGYETLKDNLQRTKLSTTNYDNFNISATYLPVIQIPSITIGYTKNSAKNDIDINDSTFGYFAINDETDRYFIQMSQNVFYLFSNQLSFGASYMERSDFSLLNYNAYNANIFFGVNSNIDPTLSANFTLNYNATKLSQFDFTYFTLGFGARKYLMENRLQLMASFNPSFGDIERRAFDFRAQYNLYANLNLTFQLVYLNNSNAYDDYITGITASYDIF